MKKDESVIPEGIYCYTYEDGIMKRCPYWGKSMRQEYQNNGYCSFLEMGDWQMEGNTLLWDQCKECGINDNFDDPFEENVKDINDGIKDLYKKMQEAETKFDYTKSNEIQKDINDITTEIHKICDEFECDNKDDEDVL